ncbi:MAG: TM2 domain-containing protein [Phycisphaeraceae bacterium]|nr:TM2 domain-containing protein [Phycisphaeraceae bacterium]
MNQNTLLPASATTAPRKSVLAGYALWLGGFVFLCGLHRLYYGRHLSGFIYLLTFGLLGIGQLVDFLLIPSMAADWNRRLGGSNFNTNQNQNQATQQVVVNIDPSMMQPSAGPPAGQSADHAEGIAA